MVFVATIYAPKVIFELRGEYANDKYLNFIIQENVKKYVNLNRIILDYQKTVILKGGGPPQFFFKPNF